MAPPLHLPVLPLRSSHLAVLASPSLSSPATLITGIAFALALVFTAIAYSLYRKTVHTMGSVHEPTIAESTMHTGRLRHTGNYACACDVCDTCRYNWSCRGNLHRHYPHWLDQASIGTAVAIHIAIVIIGAHR